MDLAELGVDSGYWDTAGQWHDAPPATLDAVATAVDAARAPDAPDDRPVFVRPGRAERLAGPADLVLDDGTTVSSITSLPVDLPLGYHRLVPLDGGASTLLIATPGRCHLQADLRTWGVVAQLPSTRSRRSWGIGDFADLHRLGRWAARQGAGVLAVSPLHAPGMTTPIQSSPYYPSSRRFLNPLHIRVEAVPGAAQSSETIDRLAHEGRGLNAGPHLERDRVWKLKREALYGCYAQMGPNPAFETFLRQRTSLAEWTAYCTIADEHGADWRRWPVDLRSPTSRAVARFTSRRMPRVRFHAWLQWVAEAQLAAASTPLAVVHDLAVGFDPAGADAWAFQDELALDMRIGAPPDEFQPEGQEWGLPPFVPWKLRAGGFRPFIETLRAVFAKAGGLHVDHVMGLFRLFWVPPDGGPRAGTFVRYPASDLLDLLALESHRAGAFVVGEDLGTVEDGVRDELRARSVLSYRVMWFEDRRPRDWPAQSFGSVTTHDLPTIAGLWEGTDPAAADMNEARSRLVDATGAPHDAPVDAVVEAAHRALAEAASAVVVATLEDMLAVPERPNLPGTVDGSNWSVALPKTLEDIEADPLVNTVIDALRPHS